MIGGFILPDRGSVVIDGQDVTELPPNKRPTNTVFQSYAIFPHLNVRDNIAYGLRTERVAKAELDTRVAQALAMIKLEHCAEKQSNQLSGGERQRVALARALVKRPKVLLLDEPLGALDKRLRESMQIELRQLQREVGITFVFVTHDQEEALSMSDRIAVMEKGKVLQVADPKTLYEAPALARGRELHRHDEPLRRPRRRRVRRLGRGGDTRLGAARSATPRTARPRGAGSSVLVAIRPESLLAVAPAAGRPLASLPLDLHGLFRRPQPVPGGGSRACRQPWRWQPEPPARRAFDGGRSAPSLLAVRRYRAASAPIEERDDFALGLIPL